MALLLPRTVQDLRDADYITRLAISKDIEAKLKSPGTHIALVGPGGIGKTQLALDYAVHNNGSKTTPYTSILWVNAGSRTQLEQSLKAIVEQIDTSTDHGSEIGIWHRIQTWLNDDKNSPWLLVLDEVENASLEYEILFTQGLGRRTINSAVADCPGGSILITTRNEVEAQKIAPGSTTIHVQPMDVTESILLLEKKMNNNSTPYSQLAHALDGVPLAMAIAAGCLNAGFCTPEEYINSCKTDSETMKRLWESENTSGINHKLLLQPIILAWSISFEELATVNPTAVDMFCQLSFCESSQIQAFLGVGIAIGEDDILRSVGTPEADMALLEQAGFVRRKQDETETWVMPSTVQQITLLWLRESGNLDSALETYLSRLETLFPSGNFENQAYCEVLYPHVERILGQRPSTHTALLDWAQIMFYGAWFKMASSQWAIAERLLAASLDAYMAELGPDHVRTLASMGLQGSLLHAQGQNNEAETVVREVLERRIALQGMFHSDTLSTRSNLASILMNQDRWDECYRLLSESLDKRQVLSASDLSAHLDTMSHFSTVLIKQKRYEEAELIDREILERRTELLGPDHPATLSATANLGLTLAEKGSIEDAMILQKQVLDNRLRILGARNPQTMITMSNYSVLLWKQGREEEAISLQKQAVNGLTAVLGPDHPTTRSAISIISKTSRPAGHKEEAVQDTG